MRKLLVENCRWTNDFIEYENKIEKKFTNRIISEFKYEDGSIRHIKRMTYRDGKEIQSLTVRVTLVIDMGKFFKETIAYDIYTDELSDFISFRKGYGTDYTLFKKKDLSKIADFIIKEVNSKIVKKSLNSNISNKKMIK